MSSPSSELKRNFNSWWWIALFDLTIWWAGQQVVTTQENKLILFFVLFCSVCRTFFVSIEFFHLALQHVWWCSLPDGSVASRCLISVRCESLPLAIVVAVAPTLRLLFNDQFVGLWSCRQRLAVATRCALRVARCAQPNDFRKSGCIWTQRSPTSHVLWQHLCQQSRQLVGSGPCRNVVRAIPLRFACVSAANHWIMHFALYFSFWVGSNHTRPSCSFNWIRKLC